MLVFYVLPNGEHRPALIVKQWTPETANLVVFLDGLNDNPSGELMRWETSIAHDPTGAPDTWHRIEDRPVATLGQCPQCGRYLERGEVKTAGDTTGEIAILPALVCVVHGPQFIMTD